MVERPQEHRKAKLLSKLVLTSGKADDATIRSSYKERKGNALASGADEGRDKLR